MSKTTEAPVSLNALAADWQLAEARDLRSEAEKCGAGHVVDDLDYALETGLRADIQSAVEYARRQLGVVCTRCGVEFEHPQDQPTDCERCTPWEDR